MKSPEEIILEMKWSYDSDPGRFQLWEQLIKPAMIKYSRQQLAELSDENIRLKEHEVVKLFRQPAVINSVCDCNKWHDRMEESNNFCSTCDKPIK